MSLFQWLENHARTRPQHPAVIDGLERVSYRELWQRSGAQAQRLQTLQVGRGDRVAVLSPNRIEILELLFACARLGAILVPLNWRLTVAEQARIVEDCRPTVLLDKLEPAGRAELAPAETIDGPLLILYTGGTTGTPRGAVLTHASIAANARSTVQGWGLKPDDIAPIFTPMFHTGGLNVLATPLLSIGGTLVLPPPFTADSALQIIAQERCTQVFLVPSMFTMLRESPLFNPTHLRHVRAFVSGGAPCPQSMMQAWWDDGLPLRQGYGLTEAGPNNFGATVADARQRPGTVGRPLPGVEVRLAADGELLIRGPHVMQGYWRTPAHEGWLHTGDLARQDEDGFFYICGRSKEMYISGGENVFPAEVEAVILTHPEVLEAAVVGVPDERWGEVGKAFIVRRPGTHIESSHIVDFCRPLLARYKTPRQVEFVDALPKSSAGKILKRLLVEVG